VYHTEYYAKRSNQLNCYTVELNDNKSRQYFGTITNFILLEKQVYCIVRLFTISKENQVFKNLDEITKKYCEQFFKRVDDSNEYVLIKPSNLIRRCLIIKNLGLNFLTPCLEIEHD
jgi:hypothetical protein